MNNINGIISKTPSLNIPIAKTPNLHAAPSVAPAAETWFTPKNLITLGLLVVVLALLGMNIFGYLGEGVDIFGSILQKLGLQTAHVAENTVDLSMDGVKLGADVAAGTVKDAADLVKSGVGTGDSKPKNKNISDTVNETPEERAPKQRKPADEDQSSDSKIQTRGSNNKAGWCYIGTDRNVRSCTQVRDSSKCMSGDIFPSRELCVNPKLRA